MPGVGGGWVGRRDVAACAEYEPEDAAVACLKFLNERPGNVGRVDRLILHDGWVAGNADQPTERGAFRPAGKHEVQLLVRRIFHAGEAVAACRTVGANLAIGVDRPAIEYPTCGGRPARNEPRRL